MAGGGSVPNDGACGDCGSANKEEYLTILEFTHFCEFFSFNYVEENRKEKTLIQKITVAVAFELETGNTKNPDIKVNMDTIESWHEIALWARDADIPFCD